MLWFQSYKSKSTFYPYVLFLAMAAILVGWPGHRTHFFNKIPQWWLWPSLVKFGPVVSEEKIFVKVNKDDDGRQVMRKAHLALWPIYSACTCLDSELLFNSSNELRKQDIMLLKNFPKQGFSMSVHFFGMWWGWGQFDHRTIGFYSYFYTWLNLRILANKTLNFKDKPWVFLIQFYLLGPTHIKSIG